ncbi:MAG: Holliday junction resolvase RecU [Bacillota bacterium]|nr:Holliday junction resolvase RecU [Bacillota bacterium]
MRFKRGVRGTALEKLIEFTNTRYLEFGLGRVDKIATPIKIVELDNGMITKGYFEKPSTVDFVGIIQGVFVAFDAKETEAASLPLDNIHPHQVAYMEDIKKQGGLAFLIVHFKRYDEYYLIPLETLQEYYYDDDIKRIPYKEMQRCIRIELDDSGLLRYIDALNELVQ